VTREPENDWVRLPPPPAPPHQRVDTQAWRRLPCAVRLQGADNPLIHILSIAQLMEINEAFHRFGAPCCVHPRGLLRSAQLAP